MNIAVIKYWGKRDEKLILPINSSLSGTIDQDTMCSRTIIMASRSYATDTLILNGKYDDWCLFRHHLALAFMICI